MALPLRRLRALALLVLLAFVVLACGRSEPDGGRALRLATTTSLVDSGLLAALVPAFEKATGYKVEVSAVGSGKALELLREGKVDAAITHSPEEEQAAVGAGRAGRSSPFMHNAFVLVGPKDQIGVVAGAGDIGTAMRAIAGSGRRFISRADGSGTHRRETALWRSVGLSAELGFIVRAGAGMAATLDRASREGAFTLTDRATFAAKRKELNLAIVFQGDRALDNVYSVIEPVASAEGANVKGASALAAFVRSAEGRALIGAFGVEEHGEALFTPVPLAMEPR